MVDSIKFLVVYVVVSISIVVVGWNQPLRYRFMSKEEIAAIHAPEPTPRPGEWMWDKKRENSLEHATYGRRSSSYRGFFGR